MSWRSFQALVCGIKREPRSALMHAYKLHSAGMFIGCWREKCLRKYTRKICKSWSKREDTTTRDIFPFVTDLWSNCTGRWSWEQLLHIKIIQNSRIMFGCGSCNIPCALKYCLAINSGHNNFKSVICTTVTTCISLCKLSCATTFTTVHRLIDWDTVKVLVTKGPQNFPDLRQKGFAN